MKSDNNVKKKLQLDVKIKLFDAELAQILINYLSLSQKEDK